MNIPQITVLDIYDGTPSLSGPRVAGLSRQTGAAIDSIRGHIANLQKEIAQQEKQQKDDFGQEFGALQSQIASLQSQLAALQKEKEDQERLKAEREKAAQEKEQKMATALADLKAEHERLVQEREEVERRFTDALQAQHAAFSLNLDARIQQLQKEQKDEFSQEFDDLQSQIASLPHDSPDLKASEERIAAIQSKRMEKALTQLRQEIDSQMSQVESQTSEAVARLDQASAALAKKVEEQKQAMETRIKEVQAELASVTDQSSDQYLKLQQELQALQTSQQQLLIEYTAKQHLLEQQARIYQIPELRLFYRIVQLKLTEIFVAMKTLACGLVSVKVGGMSGAMQQGIKLLGHTVMIPGVTILTAAIAKAIGQSAQREAQEQMRQLSALIPTLTEIERIAEETARGLTLRYEHQLLALVPEGATLLGECALVRMIQYLDENSLPAGCEPQQLISLLCEQLIAAPSRIQIKQGFLHLVNKPIPLKDASQTRWTESGIFTKCGIRVIDPDAKEGMPQCRWFSGTATFKPPVGKEVRIQTRPEKYGYCLGTEIEARSLGLQQTLQPIPSKLVSIPAAAQLLPAAASPQTMSLQSSPAQQSALEQYVQELQLLSQQQAQQIHELQEQKQQQAQQLTELQQQQSKQFQALQEQMQQMMQMLRAQQAQEKQPEQTEPPNFSAFFAQPSPQPP